MIQHAVRELGLCADTVGARTPPKASGALPRFHGTASATWLSDGRARSLRRTSLSRVVGLPAGAESSSGLPQDGRTRPSATRRFSGASVLSKGSEATVFCDPSVPDSPRDGCGGYRRSGSDVAHGPQASSGQRSIGTSGGCSKRMLVTRCAPDNAAERRIGVSRLRFRP